MKTTKKQMLTYFLLLFMGSAISQEYFVHPHEGLDTNPGTMESPFKSIEKAVFTANLLTGSGDITIHLMPGTYVLENKIAINPVRVPTDSTSFIIKGHYLPDHSNWSPENMPTIQSISGNNSSTFFGHSVGFLVAARNVVFQGIRFLGNSNPQVKYYYPITKENPELGNLSVMQCMFIGDKESSKIQGGIWAHGPNNIVDHSVFYECRNAVLFFDNVEGFRISNSIIYKSYESAFWFGPEDMKFEFYNNVLSQNEHLLVGRSKDLKYSSPLQESIISGGTKVGYWSRAEGRIVPIKNPDIVLTNISKSMSISIIENDGAVLPKRHLHLGNWSKKETAPGIFMKK